MKVVGLTGGIASGKSTVTRCLRKLGATVLDADEAARAVVAKGAEAYAAVVAAFGPDYLLPDGELNRPLLGQRIFSDRAAREQLNALVHPAVRARLWAGVEAARAQGLPAVVLDIPLLFETGWHRLVEPIWLVWVDEATQLARLMARDGLSEAEARARIRAQLPLSEKRGLADLVIDNRGTLAETEAQVATAWQQLLGG